jgi:hypothetical protein
VYARMSRSYPGAWVVYKGVKMEVWYWYKQLLQRLDYALA